MNESRPTARPATGTVALWSGAPVEVDRQPDDGAADGLSAGPPETPVEAGPVGTVGWVLELLRLAAVIYLTTCLMLTAWTLLPLLAGWKVAVITTGSMEPMIRPGDVVMFDEPKLSTLTVGQVIIFTDPARPSRQLTHRIKEIKSDGTIVTKGDANQSPDVLPVPKANIHGRGRLVVPYVGRMALWNTPDASSAHNWLATLLLALGTMQVATRLSRRRARAAAAATQPEPSAPVAPEPTEPDAAWSAEADAARSGDAETWSTEADTESPPSPAAARVRQSRRTNQPKARL